MAINVPLTSAPNDGSAALNPGMATGFAGSLGATGGISDVSGLPTSPTSSPMDFAPGAGGRLGRNPMLPQHPVDAALDSQYMAQEAQLRAQVARQYADILQQLGYTDDSGNFIPGSVEVNASMKKNDLNRSSDLAGEDVTHQAQQQGTLFSGLRGTNTARAQYPFQQQLAQLGIDVPMNLAQLHEQASGLIDDYTLQNNMYLAAAAQRKAASLAAVGGLTPDPNATLSAPINTSPGAPAPADTTPAADGSNVSLYAPPLGTPPPAPQIASSGGGIFPSTSLLTTALARAAAHPDTQQISFGAPAAPTPNAYLTNANKRG